MTRTIRRLRRVAGTLLAEVGGAVGTFLVLSWLAINVVRAGERALGASLVAAGLPALGVWLLVLAVAVAATIRLERGGYRRLGAATDAGLEFALLSVLCLPWALFPTAYALSAVVDGPALLTNGYFVGCVLLGAWLALYGGRERLGLDRSQFVRAAAVALAALVGVWAVDSVIHATVDLAALAGARIGADATRVTVGLAWQAVVLVAGFGRPTPPSDGPVLGSRE